MRIIGVDPGSRITGYGIIESNTASLERVGFGAIRVHVKHSFPERLKEVFEGINEILAEYKPQVLAIEDVFYARNIQSVLKLGQVRGVIILAAAMFNLPVVEYSPRKVKQAVTGNGAASKEQVRKAVFHLLRMKDEPIAFDITDALAIAICHSHRAQLKY